MAKIDPSLRLTDEQITKLLSEEPRLRIATIGPGSDINLTPMTFGYANGKIYIFARGQKIANLRRDGVATILVDVGGAWRELQGVMLRGQAVVLEDAQAEAADVDLQTAQMNLGLKHGLKKNGEVQPYTATASGRSRRWIVFTPEKVTTWDNSKLPG